jgi:transposase-like protein
MVDYSLFKTILETKDCGYIEDNDRISFDLLKLFSNSKTEKVNNLFVKGNNSSKHSYIVELKCDVCGKLHDRVVNKIKLTNYISDLRKNKQNFKCNECIAEFKKIEEQNRVTRSQMLHADRIEKTNMYIQTYLNHLKEWKDDIKSYQKINLLNELNIEWELISEHIKDMEYHDFLNTPYWKAISEKVKIKAGYKCQLCNSNKNLSVHHRSYINHGDELHNMDDLICICQNCHQIHHDNK